MEYQGVCHEVRQEFDFGSQIVFLTEKLQLGMAVFASRSDDGCPGLFDLVGLRLSSFFSEFFRFVVEGNESPTSTATPIVLPAGRHFLEMGRQMLQDISWFFDDPAVAGGLAGIVVGHDSVRSIFLELYFPLVDITGNDF